MSSTGTITSTSSGLRTPASTIVTGRAESSMIATEEARDLVERSLRRRQPDALAAVAVGVSARSASRRSSVSERCAPRLVAASAWISSTITYSTVRNVSRADDVNMR